MVAFPDQRYFVSNGKLLVDALVLNQTMKAIFPDKESAKFIESLGTTIQTTLSFTLVLIIIGQWFMKSIIKSIWPYFTTLQLLLLIEFYD